MDISPQARETKEKNKQIGLHQTGKFLPAKENINKIKSQPIEWEAISANVSDKGLVSKIYKYLTKLNTKKPNSPTKKWAKSLKRHVSKDDIQMANRHIKGCSMSLIIREMQIKATVRYYLTPIRMAIISKSTNMRWRGCGERGTILHCWWECRLVQPLWKQYGDTSKN